MVTAKPIATPRNATLPAEPPTTDVLLLPREVSEGRALYDDSVIALAKEIRAAGASAEYQHDASSREWIGEKHVPVIVLDVIAGLLSNAGWAGLCAVIAKRKGEHVRVRVARWRRAPSGNEQEWFEVEGPGAEVAGALETLRRGTTVENDDGEGT